MTKKFCGILAHFHGGLRTMRKDRKADKLERQLGCGLRLRWKWRNSIFFPQRIHSLQAHDSDSFLRELSLSLHISFYLR